MFDDIDTNSSKLGATQSEKNKKLASILKSISELDFSIDHGEIDVFGDAYEYLMAMYASNAGKSGGEFFTPQEVSDLLAKLVVLNQTDINKAYDPACGSGALLLKVRKEYNKEIDLYGQEINLTSYNLARINLLLHNIGFNHIYLAHGDTLISPCEDHKKDEPFDAIVSNPPYSIKWEGDNNPLLINDDRFTPAGVLAPKSKADFAFIMHSLAWLSQKGVGAIVIFPGILYRSGAEAKIRQYLCDQNYIDSIIALSDNLFFGTNIATCIMVLKKNKVDSSVLFIDASKEFQKVTNKNKLSSQNIATILELFKNRQSIKHIAHLASYEQIKDNDYNLSVSSYVEPEDKRQSIDIKQLNTELKEIVAKCTLLRTQIEAIVQSLEA